MDGNDRRNEEVAWFGRDDTPAPQGAIHDAAPDLKIAVLEEALPASLVVRYRRPGNAWQKLEVRRAARLSGVQYYLAKFPRSQPGARIEYEVLLHRGGSERRIGEPVSFEVAMADRPAFGKTPTQIAGVEGSAEKQQRSTDRRFAPAPGAVRDRDASEGQPLDLRTAISPVTFLDKGEKVVALHNALSAAGFAIDQKEREEKRFGRSTGAAIRAFQGSQSIPGTGLVDEETLSSLNRLVSDAEEDRRSWRTRMRGCLNSAMPKLGVSVDELLARTDEVGALVRETLDADIKATISAAFKAPSDELRRAIETIELDIDEIREMQFSVLFKDRLIPSLIENGALESELQAQADMGLSLKAGTVSEVLDLGADLRLSDRFSSLANRLRNRVVGDIIGLDAAEIDALDETNLVALDGAGMERLISEGKVRAERQEELSAAADFARLTDDNIAAVRALWSQGVRQPKELVHRDSSDWVEFLKEHAIDPPSGETRESYAALLDAGVEHAFPSAYALERFGTRSPLKELKTLSDLDKVGHDVDSILADQIEVAELDQRRMHRQMRARLSSELYALRQFSNRYAALGVPDVLRDPNLDRSEKRDRIAQRVESLAKFTRAHSDLDLEVANFFPLNEGVAEAFAVDFDDVEQEDRPHVRKALMALQRAHGLTGRFVETDALLSCGLDSAAAVVDVGDAATLAERTGLPIPAAFRIRAAALETSTKITHFFHGLEAATAHAAFDPAVVKYKYEASDFELVNILKDIPGYSELFGSQNYCKCQHCRSILSPAAYFVDLMRYIEKSISVPIFLSKNLESHPLYLRNRRPDLWTLTLTCANTDTLIPYLLIVNEVLSNYLENTFGQADIFRFLADQEKSKLSFLQPFNLPFAELNVYLKHLGVSRAEIVRLFDVPMAAAARSHLGLSQEEFSTIANLQDSGVAARFGLKELDLSVLSTAQLCRAASITREELSRLLSMDFVKADLVLSVEITSDDLIGFEENLQLKPPSGVPARRDFFALFLDRLHRFVRLWRVLSWTPEELQMFLSVLIEPVTDEPASTVEAHRRLAAGLDETVLLSLAKLRQLQAELGISVSELLAIVDDIPSTNPSPRAVSLFQQLFSDRTELRIRHPLLGNTETNDPFVSADFGLLQGSLKIDEAGLVELIQHALSQEEIAAALFSKRQLSKLHRRAVMARGLGIPLRELMALERLVSAPKYPDRLSERTAHALELIEAHRTLGQTSLSPADIEQLINQHAVGAENASGEVADILADIRRELASSGVLEFTPDDLTTVNGIDRASAGALLEYLAALPSPWATRVDAGAERFRLTAGVGATPDQAVLIAALQHVGLPGQSEADPGATMLRLAGGLMAVLFRRHPLELSTTAVRARLSLSDGFLAATSQLRRVDPPADAELSGLFSWMGDESLGPPQSLLSWTSEVAFFSRLFRDLLSAPLETVRFVAENQSLFALDTDPQISWKSLCRVGRYFSRIRRLGSDFEPLHVLLKAWDGEGFPAAVDADLARTLAASVNDIAGLRSVLPSVEDPFDALGWIEGAISLAHRIGVDSIALRQLTAETYDGLVAARDLVYGAIRAKYRDDDDWKKVIEPYEEKIEGLKRDALVDRILSLELQLKFRDAGEIYQFFLLDVEMDGCARTSRVNQAISTCQLYVQRCLMGLEQSQDGSVVACIESGLARKEWEDWRKYYRIWQANREVFLYPENYLLPELRDDKSHVFREAETALLQGTLDPASVEKIISNYLRQIVELGSLLFVSCLYDSDEKEYILFGRTADQPYRYFMRRFDGASEWSVWKPIELDIGAKTVTAAKHRGALYLFWTDVVARSDAERIRQGHSDAGRGGHGSNFASVDGGQRTETVPVTISYSRLDATEKWEMPQRLFFYNLLTVRNSSPWLQVIDLSEKIFVTPPGPTDFFLRPSFAGGDPLNKLRIQVSHCTYVRYKDAYRNEYGGEAWQDIHNQIGYLDLFENRIVGVDGREAPDLPVFNEATVSLAYTSSGIHLWRPNESASVYGADSRMRLVRTSEGFGYTERNGVTPFRSPANREYFQKGSLSAYYKNEALLEAGEEFYWRLREVSGRSLDNILLIGDQAYLIKWTGGKGFQKRIILTGAEMYLATALSRRHMFRMSTSRPKDVAVKYIEGGVRGLFGRNSQIIEEKDISALRGRFHWLGELAPAVSDVFGAHPAEFQGPQAVYDRELYFHLPFMVASYLNGIGKYEQAAKTYNLIFDPLSASAPQESSGANDVWRFLEFQGRPVPKLRSLLSDPKAISIYKREPFSPFAVARERPLAFQKAVVMRYIDNLLDWGDALFRRDTIESLNEATMLYVMAADILGDRPTEVGECETFPEQFLTYSEITRQKVGGEFLLEMQNFLQMFQAWGRWRGPRELLQLATAFPFAVESASTAVGMAAPGHGADVPAKSGRGVGFKAMVDHSAPTFASFNVVTARRAARAALSDRAVEGNVPGLGDITFTPPNFEPWPTGTEPTEEADPYGPIQQQRLLGFCVPPNETLLGYWDRVEDRLFKIRHCMNIEGVVRQLPLWQPRIDPLLLVRAKAAGLDIDQILALLSDPPPYHRFTFLLEKARQFAGVAQQFGAQLLSALERKDEQELAQLRALHEDTLFKLMRRQKEDAVEAAAGERKHVCKKKAVLEARRDFYKDLIENAKADRELGINAEENKAQENFDKSKSESDAAADKEAVSARTRQAGPRWSLDGSAGTGYNWGALSAGFAIASASTSYGSDNLLAQFEHAALKHRSGARVAETDAAMALRRADYKRRKDQWIHERDSAEKELEALASEEVIAAIRVAIAEDDLAVHDAQIEQAASVYDFAKDRFTNIGLYTYLSATLGRLYRRAYDMAYQMASTAQRAYQFETDDHRFFLEADNWDASRAGLLAVDKLFLQLQMIEAAYLDRDRRRHEIVLSCPLSQFAPDALVSLRQTGRAEFTIPEWWFDLFYPGQYRRTVQSVRLTMPCVIGPYTNVGARLTLLDSWLRVSPSLDASALVGVQIGRNTSVSASKANADAGVFELRFDDAKNPPFKGAGAFSSWVLQLPERKRAFDYVTISDVLMEISYYAEQDELYRTEVEGTEDVSGVLDKVLSAGLVRMVRLREEFPSEFHKLTHASQETVAPVDLILDRSRLFPYWVGNRSMIVANMEIGLVGEPGQEFLPSSQSAIEVNGETLSNWSANPDLGFVPTVTASSPFEFGDDPVVVSIRASLHEDISVRDVVLRLTYTI